MLGDTLRSGHRWLITATVVGLVAALVGPVGAVSHELLPGDSVEGQGTYDENVWIESTGTAVFAVEDDDPSLYGAPNGVFDKNGCIGDDGGFGDLEKKQDYTFTFKETVSDFSLRMLDFGDYTPAGIGTTASMTMRAFDSDDTLVATDVLTIVGLTGINTPAYWETGDACDAVEGEPGNYTFSVSGEKIAYVTLEPSGRFDPNIAFTDLEYTGDGQCAFGGNISPLTVDLIAGQTIDAGDVTVSYNGTKLLVTFMTTGNWWLTETHLDVKSDSGDLATNSAGNPVPGQFPYSTDHEPWVMSYTYEITWDSSDFPVYIAAHAALADADFAGPFWASSVNDYSLGYRTYTQDAFRLIPASALGAPDGVFFSLGITGTFAETPYTGSIDVAFDGLIWNGPGDDVSVHETTNSRGSYPEELGMVYAYYDGDWTLLGTASSKAPDGVSYFDLGDLPYAEKIRIVDDTDPSIFGTRLIDGFDVDAVDASVLYFGEETGWGEGDRFVDRGNWGMYFKYDYQPCVWPSP